MTITDPYLSRRVGVVIGVSGSVPVGLVHRKMSPQVQVSCGPHAVQLKNLLPDGLVGLETLLEKVANEVDDLRVSRRGCAFVWGTRAVVQP